MGGRYATDDAAYRTPIKETKERRRSNPEQSVSGAIKSCEVSKQTFPGRIASSHSPLLGEPQSEQNSMESGSTNGSTAAESQQAGCPDLMYAKPRKVFNTPEERFEFVRSYKSKQKTEVRQSSNPAALQELPRVWILQIRRSLQFRPWKG